MKAPNIEIIETTYMAHPADIYTVRWQVFVDEQGIADELIMDEHDYTCQHIVALQGKIKEPVGVARIDLKQEGKIGRIAVLPDQRGQGIGKEMIKHLERIARNAGLKYIWCHAQKNAVPLYLYLQYKVEGDAFTEANIPHFRMIKFLT